VNPADDYFVWKANAAGGYCRLGVLENVPSSYETSQGISRAADFPDDAAFRMSPEFPKDVKLADNCKNLESVIVVSPTLRDWLTSQQPPSVEVLPVTIINHKGKVASSDYAIVNPLSIQDCIDKQNSNLMWNKIDPNFISTIFKLVLLPDRIDARFPMFRLQHEPTVVCVHKSLVEKIKAQGFSGLNFKPVGEYMG